MRRLAQCCAYTRYFLGRPVGTCAKHTAHSVGRSTMGTSDSNISYCELKTLLESCPDLLLIDVRTQAEVNQGKIPSSINIPVDCIDTELSLDPDAFNVKYGVQKPALDAPRLVFHCQMGRRGALAVEKASALGYKNPRNYVGGYKEWSEKERK